MKFFILITLSILLVVLPSCKSNKTGIIYKGEYKIVNINIFKDTPIWELALAVKEQKTWTIKKIVKKNPELVNFQEDKYGASLLFWAIGMEKYKSAEELLKCGADPNVVSKTSQKTPLHIAAGFSWIDNEAKKDAKYVNLLLKYGADPNRSPLTESDESDGISKFTVESSATPLMKSIGCGFEKTKALVEAGADINYTTKNGNTVAINALFEGGPGAMIEYMEYARYLVAQKGAKVTEPYYPHRIFGNPNPNKDLNEKFFPVDILRTWVYDLNSEKYKIKMEIVEEFNRQGVNYWKTEIPRPILQQIKKRYPDTWEEYIKKY